MMNEKLFDKEIYYMNENEWFITNPESWESNDDFIIDYVDKKYDSIISSIGFTKYKYDRFYIDGGPIHSRIIQYFGKKEIIDYLGNDIDYYIGIDYIRTEQIYENMGLGSILLNTAIKYIRENYPKASVVLHAFPYDYNTGIDSKLDILKHFYGKFGFREINDTFHDYLILK